MGKRSVPERFRKMSCSHLMTVGGGMTKEIWLGLLDSDAFHKRGEYKKKGKYYKVQPKGWNGNKEI